VPARKHTAVIGAWVWSGRGDQDGVEVFDVREHLAEVGERLGLGAHSRGAHEHPRVDVAHGDDLGLLDRKDLRDVPVPLPADADHADFQLLVGRGCGWQSFAASWAAASAGSVVSAAAALTAAVEARK
jgi:hypothetical protein